MNKHRPGIIILTICLLTALTAAVSQARDVTLQWNANTETTLAGYKLYYKADSSTLPFNGTGAGQGASPVNVQKQTSATLTGLDPARSYFFAVTAYDTAGLESPYSSIVSVAEALAPTVAITAPASGSTVAGTTSVSVSASDNVGVSRVEFYLDGVLTGTDTATPYLFSVNAAQLPVGSHTLSAKAYDAAGNVGSSTPVTVATVLDSTPPTVSITSPASGASVSGTTAVQMAAADNVGVSKVELYVNNTLYATYGTPPFTINWNTASGPNGSCTLTARAYDATGNMTQSAPVTVTVANTVVQPTSQTIWPSSAVPTVIDGGPDGSVELGVKFKSDTAGYITGIRFYKAAANTGTHTGSLWTATGTRLASATFTNETASGWQQVNFATPVAISANTVYVASYHLNAGHYSADQNYFTGKGMDTPPLHALASGVSGSNGVYAYGSGTIFPNQTWNNSNYWVDVVYSASTSGTTTPPPVTTPPPATVTGSTIWPATTVPAVVDAGADGSLELGVKFKSDVSGYITGIRFYKAAANTGTHTGSLWTATGTRLASATFTNETASGWQQVNFATPVAITAGTVYVASYHMNAGHYSADQTYFTGKGMDSPPLHALASGVSGANGVYAYGSGIIFPNQTWNATNYYVDVVFTTTSPTVSIWPGNPTPGVADAGADGAVELGVKFKSDVAGSITGIRFYKAAANTGTHVVNLWSATGTKLASATATNETASGWQQVNFATPVAISANTVYVASYHVNAGHYSADQGYFTGKGADNGALHALASGVSGSNGVYAYGTNSLFPNQSWNSSNYWVDVVFKP